MPSGPLSFVTKPSTLVGLVAAFFYVLATSDCDLCLRCSTLKPAFVKDQVVWITGASSGIGRALALEVAQHGGKLILSSRSKDKLEAVKIQLPAGTEAVVLPLDLSDLDSLPEKVKLAVEAFGVVDILVNNGGISTRALATEAAFSVVERVNLVDYLGQIKLTTELLPTFLKQKKGHIINISSIAGKFGVPLRSAYSAAKSALLAWMDSLRAEVSAQGHNLHVTNVSAPPPPTQSSPPPTLNICKHQPRYHYAYSCCSCASAPLRCAQGPCIPRCRRMHLLLVSTAIFSAACSRQHCLRQDSERYAWWLFRVLT
jgi:short-subunit dehydrogenase